MCSQNVRTKERGTIRKQSVGARISNLPDRVLLRGIPSCICSRLLPLVHGNLPNGMMRMYLAVLPMNQHRSAERIIMIIMIITNDDDNTIASPGLKGRCGPARGNW